MSAIVESCNVEELCISLGGSEKLLSELTDKLQDWLKLQPHLPQDASRNTLEMLILNCKMSLERAKQKLDMHYTIKPLVPELFSNRNPYEPTIAAVHNALDIVILPKLTPEKCRTWIMRVTESDASKYHPWNAAKYILMVADIVMKESHCFGDIIVYDLIMINVNHILKVTPTYVKKCETVGLEAYAARVRELHFINVPPAANRVINIVKSLLSPKIGAKLHVHPIGSMEAFYELIPKSILPKDYGGEERTMHELAVSLRKRVEGDKDWLMEQEKLLVNERLRPGSAIDADSLFGFSGSFRKLDID